jgi:hypothetical protein
MIFLMLISFSGKTSVCRGLFRILSAFLFLITTLSALNGEVIEVSPFQVQLFDNGASATGGAGTVDWSSFNCLKYK